MNFCIANSRFCEPNFPSGEPKIPQYNEWKALKNSENKEKNYLAS